MGAAAVAEADHFPAAQNVHLFGHNGALAVPCPQTVTTVESKRVHLGVKGRGTNRAEHTPRISDKQG